MIQEHLVRKPIRQIPEVGAAIQGQPSNVAQPAIPAARPSCSNLRTRSGSVAKAAGGTFSATSRFQPRVAGAIYLRYTSPILPAPMGCKDFVRA